MPLYDYRCPSCSARATVFKKIAYLDNPEPCNACATPMQRQISAPRVLADYSGYSCPITGQWVEGRKAHRENLAKHGCRVLEPGERQAAERSRKEAEEKLDRAIDATVEQTIHEMPSAKRDALAAELQHFSADVVRTSVAPT